MTSRFLRILTIALLFSNFFVSRVQAESFPNGSFESNPAGGANDWTRWSSGWSWDGSTAHSGLYSARVARSSGDQSGSIYSARLAVQPSTVYTLSYWIRSQSANFYPRVLLYQYSSNDTQIGPYLVAYPNIGGGTNDWKEIKYRFQSLAGVSKLNVRIYLGTETAGTFWFDDFRLDVEGPARFPIKAGFPVTAYGSVMLSSPAVADINNDGSNELLIGAGNTVNGWDKSGKALPGFQLETGDSQIIGQIALADLDKDGRMEVAAGTRSPAPEGQCRVFAWHSDGTRLAGWPQSVAWNSRYSHNDCWITSVVFADINGDNSLDILAGSTNNGAGYPSLNLTTPNLYAWNIDGSMVAGSWPNQQTTAGVYGALASSDVNGDGKSEVLVGRDYIYLNLYGSNGQPLPGWPIRTFVNRNNGDYDTEQRIGYGVNAPIIADLDNDHKKEIIAVGHVAGPGNPNPELVLNSAMLVLQPDGTRRVGWETAAVGNGVLAQADLPWQAPAVADLNNDGKLEIVVATEDGWIRAYRADKTVLWAFNYTQGAVLFGTEPVIGDIDGDNSLEIVFGTYVASGSGNDKDGPVGVWALESDGTVVSGFPLAIPTPGVRSAPTLADLDRDGKLDILAATRSGQVFAWNTGVNYNAFRLPWPNGRFDLARSAAYQPPIYNLNSSRSSVSPLIAQKGEASTVKVHLSSMAPIEDTVTLTTAVPSGLSYVPGTLRASSGDFNEANGVIHWSGKITGSLSVDIQYMVKVDTTLSQKIEMAVVIDAGAYGQIRRSAALYANGYSFFLPTSLK